jgi:hypothetical protein
VYVLMSCAMTRATGDPCVRRWIAAVGQQVAKVANTPMGMDKSAEWAGRRWSESLGWLAPCELHVMVGFYVMGSVILTDGTVCY